MIKENFEIRQQRGGLTQKLQGSWFPNQNDVLKSNRKMKRWRDVLMFINCLLHVRVNTEKTSKDTIPFNLPIYLKSRHFYHHCINKNLQLIEFRQHVQNQWPSFNLSPDLSESKTLVLSSDQEFSTSSPQIRAGLTRKEKYRYSCSILEQYSDSVHL